MSAELPISKTERHKSVTNEKSELRQLQANIVALQNRVKCLSQQKKKQQDKYELTRKRAQSILEKKANAEALLGDSASNDLSYLEAQQERNKYQRRSHELEMRSIKQAIYLVKLDEASQLRQMKKEHKRRMEELKSQRTSENRGKMLAIQEEQHSRKKYYDFMSQKLAAARQSQISEYMNLTRSKQQKIKIIQQLQKQQQELLNNINHSQYKVEQASREYVAAYNLPRKQALKFMESEIGSMKQSRYQNQQSPPPKKVQTVLLDPQKIPRTNLRNDAKLRLILSELKRRSLSTIE